MADLIDKNAAISIFIEGDGDDEFTNGYNFAVDEYRNKIAAIHATNRWIPVSERLPEKQCRCLVTSESGKISIQTFLFSLTYGVEPYFSGCEKVIAWMPMPDAYKPPEKE